MANDRDRALEHLEGFKIDGGPFLTGGPASPVGAVTAAYGDIYVQADGGSTKPVIWFCTGPLATDWRVINADDVNATDTSEAPPVISTVQALISQLLAGDTPGVSQTQIFGNGGNTAQNSYVSNEGVPSNIVGVPVGLADASIRSIFLGNENTRTGDVLIQERSPAGTGTFVTVYTLTLTNQSYANITGLNVPVTTGAEIAIFTTVSLKNVKIVLNINGDSAT